MRSRRLFVPALFSAAVLILAGLCATHAVAGEPTAKVPAVSPATPFTPQGPTHFRVRLGVNQDLSGHVTVPYPRPNFRPAHARLVFAQDGRIVATVMVGPDGRFTALGLRPGVYSLIA